MTTAIFVSLMGLFAADAYVFNLTMDAALFGKNGNSIVVRFAKAVAGEQQALSFISVLAVFFGILAILFLVALVATPLIVPRIIRHSDKQVPQR